MHLCTSANNCDAAYRDTNRDTNRDAYGYSNCDTYRDTFCDA